MYALLRAAVIFASVAASGAATAAGHLILAASWQPAFCETRPGVTECRSQTRERFDADHFALHGLWPQPRNKTYCSVSPGLIRTDKQRQWLGLPKLPLSQATREELNRVMPGVASGLHRHEWIKHGSCFSKLGAEHYFRVSLALMRELNASRVRELFRDRIGQRVQAGEVRRAFDKSFGHGAGKRVRMQCRRVGARTLISELQIALGPITGKRQLVSNKLFADAISRGRKLSHRCKSGLVDETGLAFGN